MTYLYADVVVFPMRRNTQDLIDRLGYPKKNILDNPFLVVQIRTYLITYDPHRAAFAVGVVGHFATFFLVKRAYVDFIWVCILDLLH